MGRMYSALVEAVAATAVQDLVSIVAPTNTSVKIHRLKVWQTTDLGDAQEEVIRLRMRSGQTSAGSVGTSGTINPIDEENSMASGATVRFNDTTQASGGTIVSNWGDGWNIRVPYTEVWTPQTQPKIKGGVRATFEMVAAPADSITLSVYLEWEEG